MPTNIRPSVHSVTVDAAPDVVFDLVADIDQHRRIFGSVVHTAYLERTETSDRIERWSWVRPLDSMRTWRAQRKLNRDNLTIAFEHENPQPPVRAATGAWSFTASDGGGTLVELRHEFTVTDTADGGDSAVGLLNRGAAAQLDQLKHFIETRDEIADLEVSYEAQLVIDEPIEDVYGYFRDAGRWNERIPHCLSATAKEDIENLQVVVMDVQVPSGAIHTTKQARVCFPNEKIIWRQLEGLPPLDDMLYGYMFFEQTPEGVLVRTGQTELLKRNGVAKRGWSVAEAKGHVAEVRGGRNLDSLKSALEYLRRRAA